MHEEILGNTHVEEAVWVEMRIPDVAQDVENKAFLFRRPLLVVRELINEQQFPTDSLQI